jgi:hypothetical protein
MSFVERGCLLLYIIYPPLMKLVEGPSFHLVVASHIDTDNACQVQQVSFTSLFSISAHVMKDWEIKRTIKNSFLVAS